MNNLKEYVSTWLLWFEEKPSARMIALYQEYTRVHARNEGITIVDETYDIIRDPFKPCAILNCTVRGHTND